MPHILTSDAKEKAALTLEGCHLVFIFDMIHFTTGANSTSMEKATLFHLSRQKMGCFRKNNSLERFPMDLVHAAATVIFILLAAEPMLEKLDRIKMKYGFYET